MSGAPRIVNNCLRYRHKAGYEYPRLPDSCRGCMYSYDPSLYDAGCSHPEGCLPRNQRKRDRDTPPGKRSG